MLWVSGTQSAGKLEVAVKLKIFLFWILAMTLSPLILEIPVVGFWIVLVTVAGPAAFGVAYLTFAGAFSGGPTITKFDLDAARRQGYQRGYHNGRNNPY